MSATPQLQAAHPSVDVAAVRAALVDVPGIEQVVLVTDSRGTEFLYVVHGEGDYARDDRIIGALVDLDLFDFHLIPAASRGMVPKGRVVL